jgi:hypothetical protein
MNMAASTKHGEGHDKHTRKKRHAWPALGKEGEKQRSPPPAALGWSRRDRLACSGLTGTGVPKSWWKGNFVPKLREAKSEWVSLSGDKVREHNGAATRCGSSSVQPHKAARLNMGCRMGLFSFPFSRLRLFFHTISCQHSPSNRGLPVNGFREWFRTSRNNFYIPLRRFAGMEDFFSRLLCKWFLASVVCMGQHGQL